MRRDQKMSLISLTSEERRTRPHMAASIPSPGRAPKAVVAQIKCLVLDPCGGVDPLRTFDRTTETYNVGLSRMPSYATLTALRRVLGTTRYRKQGVGQNGPKPCGECGEKVSTKAATCPKFSAGLPA
jgi:hypothetical protein